MPPRGPSGKRKRVPDSADTTSPPPRRSRHVDSSRGQSLRGSSLRLSSLRESRGISLDYLTLSEASETRTPRRSTRVGTDASDDEPLRRPGPQVARRSGGRLPPRSKSHTEVNDIMPPPKSRVVVEIPAAPPPPGPSRPPASTRIPLSASLANHSSQGTPSTPAQRTPRTPASRRKRAVSTASPSFSEPEVDELDSEEDEGVIVGGAGPGPRTRAIRKSRNLRPVPQPEPEVFHQYMEPKKGRATRNSLSAKASMSSVPDSQEASQVPVRPVTMIDGEEAYVIADSDSDNGVGAFECLVKRCGVACRTSIALANHLRDHADMYDPSGGKTSQNARNKIAELEKQRKAQQKAHAEAVSRLEDQKEQLGLKLNEYIGRTATALGTASQTQAKLKEKETTEEELKKEAETAKSQLAALMVQMAERDTKIASLQHKIDAFDKLDEELAEISAMPAPLDGEVLSHEHQIKVLHKKLKSKTSALKNAESESEFLRDQYKAASDSAVAEVARANKLEEEVKKLQEKLNIGLKQRDLHSANVAKQAEKAKESAEAQLDLLLEQSRRTDDALRRKASSYSRLTREVQDLETELHKARSRADDLSKRNTELSDHITLLRGRIMGAFDAAEESGNETDDEAPAVTPAAPPAIANLGPAFAPDNNSSRPSPALADTTLADGGIEMFRCKWALDGDIMCPEIFHTRDELEAHGMGHIEKLSAAIIDV